MNRVKKCDRCHMDNTCPLQEDDDAEHCFMPVPEEVPSRCV